MPAVLNQIVREKIEQLGMRRRVTLRAEIARRRDDTTPKMMLPQTIDDHARKQIAGALIDIGEPVCKCRAAQWRACVFWRFALPLFFGRAHEHAKKSGLRFVELLVWIAAFDDESFLVKIRPLRVETNRGQSFG